MSLVIEEKEIDQLPITIDPEIVSGAPVFRGTRVPVDALLSNLEAGLTLNEFLDNFPTVTREQALKVLGFSRATLQRLAESRPKETEVPSARSDTDYLALFGSGRGGFATPKEADDFIREERNASDSREGLDAED